MHLPRSTSSTKEKKKTFRGCFSGLRTTFRSLLPARRTAPTYTITFPAAFSTPIPASAAAGSPQAPPSSPASSRNIDASATAADRVSIGSFESDLDDDPIDSAIFRNARDPRPIVHPLNRLVYLRPPTSPDPAPPLLRGLPAVPEDPTPAPTLAEEAAPVLSDCVCEPDCHCQDITCWTDILIDKTQTSTVPGGPVETILLIKDRQSSAVANSRSPISLKITATAAQLTFNFSRPPTKTGESPKTTNLTADLKDYDTIRIEWNRDCAFDFMELTEDIRVKCKFENDTHFVTLRNATH